jgi:glyoxylase-like metal-dependent hydrolase (beta-lactamase superfamily II)
MSAPMAGQCGAAEALYVEAQYDAATGTVSYLLLDRTSGQCALIDTVLDYASGPGRIAHGGANQLVARVRELGATVAWILETHVHADHLSAAAYLKNAVGGQLGIGAGITAVQRAFGTLFNPAALAPPDAAQFDRLLVDGDVFHIGGLTVTAIHTPGHTPACMTYVVSDGEGVQQAAFVGDTLFMPDYGTARCDFPGGDPRQLYRSIEKILGLPPKVRLYTAHVYQTDGRALRFSATVAEQKAENIHLRGGVSEDAFVAMRTARDAGLSMPALMLPSIQVNLRGGKLPEPESNGLRYIMIPLNAF